MVRVSDTGRGIAEVDLPRVFEEYTTTDAPPSTWHSGAGLGLPISKKLVELHRGRMGVESVYQKGTTFWFTLPLETEEETAKTAVRGFTALPYTPKSAGRIIVVVHEDPRVQPALQRHLEGTLVLWAADIKAGQELVQENKAVALIVDDQAPQEEITGDYLVVRCPLPSSRRTAEEMGAADLLYKPIDFG